MKIGTLNVKGLKGQQLRKTKLLQIESYIKKHKIDVLFLQETHVDQLTLGNEIAETLGGKIFWSLTGHNSKGVAIFINNVFDAKINKFHHDVEGRLVYVDIDKGFNFRLINIYAPNDLFNRKQFFKELIQVFNTNRNIILGGDFNCVTNIALDRIGGNPQKTNDGSKELNDSIQTRNLVDVFRCLHPNTILTTWKGPETASRLDRFYFRHDQLNLIRSINQFISFSDHELVVIDVKEIEQGYEKGRGAWKFPTYLVEDLDYSYELCFRLAGFINRHDKNVTHEWWDSLKTLAKEITSKWCQSKKKIEDIRYGQLCAEYREHEKAKNINEMTRVKNIIDINEKRKTKGAQIRTKAQILDSNENPSDYFIHKEIYRGKQKIIEEVEVNGIMHRKQNEIVDAFKDFYSNLYTAERVQDVPDTYFHGLPRLEQANTDQGKSISLEEIRKALNQMENNKSPGPDGLSKEFYVKYFDLLAPLLVNLYENIFHRGQLTESMKLSYITLICKNEENPHLCKNYRPISLLNIDYKIITKVLSNRLRPCLPTLIHPDQSCSVKDRSIQDNCHYLRDIIDFINDENDVGVLLSLDQEKAFDRVDHTYLMSVLRYYRFSNNFLKWIKLLYHDISSSVLVNGNISKPFKLTRSVRQGCPLSPLLYILSLEPVLHRIRQDPTVYGCPIPGNRNNPPKLTAFADDCKFVVKTDDSAYSIIKHYEDYSKFSGSKLNKGKTEAMFLGRWRKRQNTLQNIKVVTKMSVFGITFGIDTEKENWDQVLNKIKQKLFLFSKRKLSYFGKAKLINTFILSKVWYLATIYPPNKDTLKAIEVLIFQFVWDNKHNKVNRATMYLPVKDGGIGLVYVHYKYLSLFLSQIMKVFLNNNTPWVNFGHMYLAMLLKRYDGYSFTNCTHPHRLITKPGFYMEVSKALRILTRADPSFVYTRNMTSKTFYKLLMTSLKTKPRVIDKHPTINFKILFSDLANSIIDPIALNLSFNVVHDVVPVAQTIHQRGIRCIPFCLRCPRCPETTDHLFLHCAYNHLAKQFLQHICFDALDHQITSEDIRFGPTDRTQETSQILIFLISEYRHSVWTARNKERFDNKVRGIRDSLNVLKNRIEFRMQADFVRLGQMIFERNWIKTGLARVCDAGVKFNY